MEIGSFYNMYFNKNPFNIKIQSEKKDLFFISGRIAIKYIIENLNCKKCLIPNYLCESIYSCFDNFDYYNIDNNFNIDLDNLSDLISTNPRSYDLILITRFDLLFQKKFHESNINFDKFNIVSILERPDLICDNFYLFPYKYIQILLNKI